MIGIGIDIGATNTKIIAITKTGKLLKEFRLRTLPGKGCSKFIRKLSEIIKTWKSEYGRNLKSIGIGVAGDIDPEKGIIRFSPNLGWRNINIVKPIEKVTNLKCFVENDANMAAWGAFVFDLNRKSKNVITITLGTGIGSGIIINGQLYHGSTGSAGEVGHTKIFSNGERCSCGAYGCLEAYIGSYAIIKRAKKSIKNLKAFINKYSLNFPKKLNTICIKNAADNNDKTALKIWLETGLMLGQGLANAILILNPDCLVFTGGVSKASKYILKGVKHIFFKQKIVTPFKHLKIIVSKTADLGSIGAALYGIEHTK